MLLSFRKRSWTRPSDAASLKRGAYDVRTAYRTKALDLTSTGLRYAVTKADARSRRRERHSRKAVESTRCGYLSYPGRLQARCLIFASSFFDTYFAGLTGNDDDDQLAYNVHLQRQEHEMRVCLTDYLKCLNWRST